MCVQAFGGIDFSKNFGVKSKEYYRFFNYNFYFELFNDLHIILSLTVILNITTILLIYLQ
jgi:hypothetical protein